MKLKQTYDNGRWDMASLFGVGRDHLSEEVPFGLGAEEGALKIYRAGQANSREGMWLGE